MEGAQVEQNFSNLSGLKANNLFRILELRNKMHNNQTSTNMRSPMDAVNKVVFAKSSF